MSRVTIYGMIIAFAFSSHVLAFPNAELDDQKQNDRILNHISLNWDNLSRHILKCDESISRGVSSTLYYPANYIFTQDEQADIKHCYPSAAPLPAIGFRTLDPFGYLFLPNEYVVPGGIFNEMYAWDSYFIIRGLLEENRIDEAKKIVENFIFEIRHYGRTLNVNRVYSLNRSQQPFLSSMAMAIYEAEKKNNKEDIEFLNIVYPYIIKDYQIWLKTSHVAGKTTLSRYYDFGSGPAPELKYNPDLYYLDAVKYFLNHPAAAKTNLAYKGDIHLSDPSYNIEICPEKDSHVNQLCRKVKNVGLTHKYYQSDRALRESGFDVTFRFGPFGSDTIYYAPIDLNCMLYKTEMDLNKIAALLDRHDDARKWKRRAELRKQKINQFLWNKKRGLYFDYNFKSGTQSGYEYLSTFYALWVGIATPRQAQKMVQNLPLFEKPGGLVTSTFQSGAQWDYPYGWAPLHLITIEGLKQYGYIEAADRIAKKFIHTVAANYSKEKVIREKYNVVMSTAKTSIEIGYPSNEVGFGWTNGVFLVLAHHETKR